MFFAKYIINNKETAKLYGSNESELFYRDTWNPYTDVVTLIKFAIKGRTYKERKESLSDLAARWSCSDKSGISYGECIDVECWFEQAARNYGLLREFRENAIC
jgi:hypothetical protein